jgi:hypothetical protein
MKDTILSRVIRPHKSFEGKNRTKNITKNMKGPKMVATNLLTIWPKGFPTEIPRTAYCTIMKVNEKTAI